MQQKSEQDPARGAALSAAGSCADRLAAERQHKPRTEAAAALEAAAACERARVSAMQQVTQRSSIRAALCLLCLACQVAEVLLGYTVPGCMRAAPGSKTGCSCWGLWKLAQAC